MNIWLASIVLIALSSSIYLHGLEGDFVCECPAFLNADPSSLLNVVLLGKQQQKKLVYKS